jgi:hypothetical protein
MRWVFIVAFFLVWLFCAVVAWFALTGGVIVLMFGAMIGA